TIIGRKAIVLETGLERLASTSGGENRRTTVDKSAKNVIAKNKNWINPVFNSFCSTNSKAFKVVRR
ncbi:hypothetical protein ACEV9B_24195, partial [Vibrio parahaemolyticus]